MLQRLVLKRRLDFFKRVTRVDVRACARRVAKLDEYATVLRVGLDSNGRETVGVHGGEDLFEAGEDGVRADDANVVSEADEERSSAMKVD